MENSFSFAHRLDSPAKTVGLQEANAGDSPSSSWSLKAHHGGSKIPRPAPGTPGDQGIKKSQVSSQPQAVAALRHLPLLRKAAHPAVAQTGPPPPPPTCQGSSTPLPTPSAPGLREDALRRIASELEGRLERERAAGAPQVRPAHACGPLPDVSPARAGPSDTCTAASCCSLAPPATHPVRPAWMSCRPSWTARRPRCRAWWRRRRISS